MGSCTSRCAPKGDVRAVASGRGQTCKLPSWSLRVDDLGLLTRNTAKYVDARSPEPANGRSSAPKENRATHDGAIFGIARWESREMACFARRTLHDTNDYTIDAGTTDISNFRRADPAMEQPHPNLDFGAFLASSCGKKRVLVSDTREAGGETRTPCP